MFWIIRRLDAGIYAIVLGAGLLFAIGPWLARYSTDSILRHSAEISALQWADYLGQTIPDLANVSKGLRPDVRNIERTTVRSSRVGGVFRTKFFDLNGQLVFDTDNPNRDDTGVGNLETHNVNAVMTLNTGLPYLKVAEGDGTKRPLHYSEAYVRLTEDGKPIGTIEVYVDQTALFNSLQETLNFLSVTMLALAGFAFLFPASAYLVKLKKQQNNTELALDHATNHDMLTGILNRRLFKECVDDLLKSGHDVAIHFVDIDKFKSINDLMGHEVGDRLLKKVSLRLQELSKSDDVIGRYGGDEFVVCQPLSDSKSAELLANRIVAKMGQPFQLGDHDVQAGVSVGYSISTKDNCDSSRLIKAADIAMYKAKSNGRGQAVSYQPVMETIRRERLLIEDCLRNALRQNRFELFFQPIFDAKGADLFGFEALLRLRDYDGGIIPPSDFIPIAEDMGLMEEIGTWVVVNACCSAVRWPAHLKVSVNLSVTQFSSGNIVKIVSDALQSTKMLPSRLQLEVTESVLITDANSVLEQLGLLRALGVFLSLDDFGTGYSSLNYLWRYPFDNIKLDRSFVNEIGLGREKTDAILNMIVNMGQTLRLSITAEGVETQDQMKALQALKCTYLQGFHLGKPISESDVHLFLLKGMTSTAKGTSMLTEEPDIQFQKSS